MNTNNTTQEQITELQALRNAANNLLPPELMVFETRNQDKRIKIKKYFLHNQQKGETISPVLDYENLNHFILGYGKALKSVSPSPAPQEQGKHTAGEWKTENGMSEIKVFTDDMYICTVWEIDISPEEAEANAALIASAPRLLAENESLKEQVRVLREALKEGIYDMKEWRDYNVRETDSFTGNEKQMIIDIARDVTVRIEKAESALKQTK